MAVWALIQASIKTIDGSREKPFSISTKHDEQYASLIISPVRLGIVQEGKEPLGQAIEKMEQIPMIADEERALLSALLLLKKAHAGAQFNGNVDTGTLTVRIPFRHNTKAG